MGHLDSQIEFNEESLAQMAHDMRAPLQALKAVIAVSGELDERKKTLIKNSIVRLEALAEGVLAHNKSTQQPKCLIVATQNIIEEFRTYSKCKIDFHLYAIESPMFLKCDEIRTMERIITILITNALEASENQSNIRVSLFSLDNKIILEVKDNGHGMSKSDIKKIGRKGFTKNKENGNGLGLAFIKEKVQGLKGKMEVVSRLKQGTTFKVEVFKQQYPALFNSSKVLEPV